MLFRIETRENKFALQNKKKGKISLPLKWRRFVHNLFLTSQSFCFKEKGQQRVESLVLTGATEEPVSRSSSRPVTDHLSVSNSANAVQGLEEPFRSSLSSSEARRPREVGIVFPRLPDFHLFIP